MFGALFKVGSLRVCTLVLVIVVLPFCTDREYIRYFLPVVSIIMALWFLCLDATADHFYVKKKLVYNFTRWLTGLLAFVFIVKMGVIYSVPDENMEMLTFVNLKNIYSCLLSEISFFQRLVSFILRALYHLFGLLKPFIYIVYLTINSLILLYLMEIVITRLYFALQNGVLTERNFVTETIPEGIYNRTALLDNTSISDDNEIYTQFPIKSCYTDEFRNDYIRYTGEDVRIECTFFLKFYKGNSRLKSFTSYWLKDGQIFISHNNARIEEKTHIDVLEVSLWIQMSLSIKFLEPKDFGVYKCICDYTVVISELHTIPIMTTENTFIYHFIPYETELHKICYSGTHFVLRSADLVEYIEMPVGNLAHIIKFFYITEAQVDEISFEYNVNGKDVHSICRPDHGSCTLPVIIYWYWKYGGTVKDILRWHTMQYGSYIDLRSCVCGNFYGEHSLTMYIPYFNSTTQREEIVEIVHEKRLIIEPVAFWWSKNSTKYHKMVLEPATEKSKFNEYVIGLVCSSQELNFFVINFISYCTFSAVLIVLGRLFTYPWRYYCRLTVMPVRNLVFYGYLTRPPKPLKEDLDKVAEIEQHDAIHDVYLSYSAEDYKWSKDILLPFLEEDCGYSVCFPDRDLAHEPGKSKLVLYSSATQASNKFVIVLSQSYINDPDCNRLQLSTCILPLINEDHETERIVIFIKRTCGITMPVQLKWNMVVYTVDWTKENFENDAKIQLKRYLTYKGMY